MKPVFIEDIGAACNLGADWPMIWTRLLAGDRETVAFKEIERRIPIDVEVAGIPDLDRSLDARRSGAGAACRLAARALGALPDDESAKVFGATNHGDSDVVLEIAMAAAKGSEADPALIAALEVDPMPLHALAMAGGAGRPSIWSYSACASGAHALALAIGALTRGPDGRATVVAADALSTLAVAGFSRIGAVSRSGAPPLTVESDGILIGEGAAALILSRRPGPIAILGIGVSCDAGHQIHPDEAGTALSRAIRQALRTSHLRVDDIGAAILHGTGTPASDAVEAAVISCLFGDCALPVTSLKGLIGHCMGAAGLFNILAAAAVYQQGLVPPVSCGKFAARAGLDVVIGSAREVPRHDPVLVLASGFGGNHVAIVVGRAA